MDPNNQTIQPVQPSVQNPIEPLSSGSSSSQKNFWKHIGIGMAIVSCLTAIGIIGFLFSQKPKPKAPEVTNLQPTPTIQSSPTLNPPVIPYAIIYPPGWKANLSTDSASFNFSPQPGSGSDSITSIYLTIHDSTLTLKDWVGQNIEKPALDFYKSHDGNTSDLKESTIARNNKQILVVLGAYVPGALPTIGAFIKDDNKIIELTIDNDSQASKETLVEMISTFKFTDAVSDTEKQQIDAWIKANNLNSYGDIRETAYPGGTPLFDETTGKYKDKYQYIVERHPERPWKNKIVGPGEHCGGNIANAPVCQSGYHCAPNAGQTIPVGDIGGVCVKD